MYIRKADFAKDHEDISKIRYDVFVKEQQVPEHLEMDARDPFCIHLLAFNAGKAIGTCRLDVDKQGKVGRLAVISTMRTQGIGTALMREIHKLAINHSLSKTWCHAQLSVLPFYEKLGYQSIGEYFYEANIEYVRMERRSNRSFTNSNITSI